MDNGFSEAEKEEIKALFPDKYQDALGKAKLTKSLGAEFQLTFSTTPDMYDFIRLFNREDFSEEILNRWSIGILGKCDNCGNINMSGGMDANLIELNQGKINDMDEKGIKVLNFCIACQLNLLGSEGLAAKSEETRAEVMKIEDYREKRLKSGS